MPSTAAASTIRTYAVSDIHGHPVELVAALHAADLVDAEGDWVGRDARLWFLGDFFDRGADGIGVVDLVMRLQHQAVAAGGHVGALVGNHEVLALGMHDFGDQRVPAADGGSASFADSWLINGGRVKDQERLAAEHLQWLRALPAMALEGDMLLMHSDTMAYLAWGTSIEQVNTALSTVLHSTALASWWQTWAQMTSRFAFRGEGGAAAAADLLSTFGGRRVVHGHSPLTILTGVPSAEITAPLLYADGLALGIDGGLFDGGPCLVVPLESPA